MTTSKDIQGLLLIDKPKGWTSFDVVAKVRGVLKQHLKEFPELYACEQCEEAARRAIEATNGVAEMSLAAGDKAMTQEVILRRQIYSAPKNHRHKLRVGHSGTLDPAATGLLVLAIGKATKQIQTLTKLSKVYEVELTLGKTSTTDDQEGEIALVSDKKPSETELKKAISEFIGEIEQIPPIYSAIKIDGKRAYKLAREGKAPKMEARRVTIRSISDVEYAYPKVTFVADVSSGTYIRSLARDIGDKLETGAYMSELRRLSIGESRVKGAFSVSGTLTGVELLQYIDKNIKKC